MNYDLTVDRLRYILDQIAINGHGGDLVALTFDLPGGPSVMPVSGVCCGGVEPAQEEREVDRVAENGDGFTFIQCENSLSTGFWKDQLRSRKLQLTRTRKKI